MQFFWFRLIKFLMFPVRRLEALIPKQGTIVDLGCGNGFFSHLLATREPNRRVIGYDWDASRLEKGKKLRHLANLDLRVADIFTALQQPDHAHHFLISDVLYLLPPEAQDRVLATCYRLLPPGGSLILKVSDISPRWKYRWEMLQESLAVKLLGVSKTGALSFFNRSGDEYTAILSRLGFSVSILRLDRWRPYPHAVCIAKKTIDHRL